MSDPIFHVDLSIKKFGERENFSKKVIWLIRAGNRFHLARISFNEEWENESTAL